MLSMRSVLGLTCADSVTDILVDLHDRQNPLIIIEFKFGMPDAKALAQLFLELICASSYCICILTIETPASCRWSEQVNQFQGIAYLWPFGQSHRVQILLLWSLHPPILLRRGYSCQHSKDHRVRRHDERYVSFSFAVIQSLLPPPVSNKIFGVVLSAYMDGLRANITKRKDRVQRNNVIPSEVYWVWNYWDICGFRWWIRRLGSRQDGRLQLFLESMLFQQIDWLRLTLTVAFRTY